MRNDVGSLGQYSRRASWLALWLLCTGCAHTARQETVSDEAASQAADTALTMLGKPYRFGGYSPASGFDCSGLVYYSYQQAGLRVPRDTQGQRYQGKLIAMRNLRKGDLLFFNQRGKRFSHVAIYLGENRFVHAPATGKTVRIDSLSNSYWNKHYVGARRF